MRIVNNCTASLYLDTSCFSRLGSFRCSYFFKWCRVEHETIDKAIKVSPILGHSNWRLETY